MIDNLFNVNQAAFILKVHPLTIRRYIREGKLKAVKVGGNVRITESQLQGFNKDFFPRPAQSKSIAQEKRTIAKIFTIDDPLFRLQGRGASIQLST